MFEERIIVKVVLYHLLVCGVVGRTPATPMARYRDVLTTQGTVRGYYVPHPPHYAYLGLPYARPPTRYDRFKAPKPPRSWSGIFEATHRVKCPQPDGSGDENCLVINVFIPEHATSLPVILHFHNGGFQRGWGSFKTPFKLLERGFVYVTFNYRIGVLGFLCLGLENVPGNAGLKDQVAALYWVKRNIEKFGGNPSDVTVYGTGSGAVSIEILLLSGLTIDLFQKAILESGSVLSPTSISHNPVQDAIELAKSLGSVTASLEDYYRDIHVNKLVNVSRMFLPCVEKEFRLSHSLLDIDPREIFESNKYQQVPMLIAYTNAEEVALIAHDVERFGSIPEEFDDLLPHDIIYDNDETKAKVAELVKKFYFDDIELKENIRQSYIDYINDVFMDYPVVKSAAYHAKNGNPVFLMKFLYKGKLNGNINNNIPGAGYGDVSLFVSTSEHLEEYDEIAAERLVTLLTNFIKLGDPTPLTTPLIPEIWQPVVIRQLEGKIVLRNIPCLMFGRNIKNEELIGQQYTLWDRIYNKFYINSKD